jgi:hypothetical protein
LLLNSLGYEASCDIENITDSEAMRKVIKKTLDNAVNDIFQSSHNKVVSTEKGGIFMLDLALENDKAKQKRIYEILDLITIALEKDSLEGYQQLYEN